MSFVVGLTAALAGNTVIGVGNCLQKYALTHGEALNQSASNPNYSSDSDASPPPTPRSMSRSKPYTYSRINDKVWLTGITLVYLGELCGNWIALSLIPASVVTPLGILAVIINAVLASCFLNEHISSKQRLGYVWILLGVLTTILFSATTTKDIENDLLTGARLVSYITQPRVIVWLCVIVLAECSLIATVRTRNKEQSSLVLYVIITAGFGAVTVVASKFLAVLLRLWMMDARKEEGGLIDVFSDGEAVSIPMVALLMTALAVALTVGISGQEICKQIALSKYKVTQFQPMFYASHVTFVAISGMIVFKEVGVWWSMLGFMAGVLAIIRGAIYLLDGDELFLSDEEAEYDCDIQSESASDDFEHLETDALLGPRVNRNNVPNPNSTDAGIARPSSFAIEVRAGMLSVESLVKEPKSGTK
ncbi:3546_t:CDS:2 [Paraglomus brasilianum]|uniref:3546_t:CDS:1 n=1 Tax=Paraglomus brasilianum TaxID=144538 RepID=A0A9N9CT60_9GLOM|nr:3546_t:CDS:2 [Paraglomus brasilianum]